MGLKILTGTLKGKVIPFRPQVGLRPTSDKVRKAIVDTLQHKIAGAKTLELFAGTGLLGLEFLSNEADSVDFIENDKTRSRFLREAITSLRVPGKVICSDVFEALKKLAAQNKQYDIIFADPPYEKGFAQKTLEHLGPFNLLKPDGVLVLESSKKELLPERVESLKLHKRSVYGDSQLHFYLQDAD